MYSRQQCLFARLLIDVVVLSLVVFNGSSVVYTDVDANIISATDEYHHHHHHHSDRRVAYEPVLAKIR